MSDIATDDGFDIDLRARLRSGEGGEVTLRQVALGLHPVILMSFDAENPETLGVEIDATGFDVEALIELFETLTEALKDSGNPGEGDSE